MFCIFADDATFLAYDKDLNPLINGLEYNNLLVIEWFENNYKKINQENCHLIVSGHKYENIFASVSQSMIWETENQKLLGIIKNIELNFYDYVISICRKVGKKLSMLASLSYYMSTK